MKPPFGKPERRGAVAPLMSILLIPFLAMAAFAVDIGWIVLAQSELQNAADAAALAAAQQLMGQPALNPGTGSYSLTNGFVDYYTPGQPAARQTAIVNTATAA